MLHPPVTPLYINGEYQKVRRSLMLPILVKEVRRLSQEEGLTDTEIAKMIGCSRSTVIRARKQYQIPSCNVMNKKDKTYACGICGKTVTIRRCERRQYACPKCMGKS